MFKNIFKAMKDPEKLWSYLLVNLGALRIKKIYQDGQLFFSYNGELFPGYLSHGNASSFILEKAKNFCQGKGIDVGAGDWAFPGAIPIQEEDYQNAYKLDLFQDNSLDYVFSSHCLEHLKQWDQALALWIRKIKSGGVLFLYLPHESMKLWNPGAPWVGYYHKWQPKQEILIPFLKRRGMVILEFNAFRDHYWSFHIVARKPAI